MRPSSDEVICTSKLSYLRPHSLSNFYPTRAFRNIGVGTSKIRKAIANNNNSLTVSNVFTEITCKLKKHIPNRITNKTHELTHYYLNVKS